MMPISMPEWAVKSNAAGHNVQLGLSTTAEGEKRLTWFCQGSDTCSCFSTITK